ncbi:hypothetical protein FRB94_010092 [Tulasnella sp. JGI-2019a]|nr:hypothetical protein FRB94_010092 [Tulasnella sp. JGI-2019a]
MCLYRRRQGVRIDIVRWSVIAMFLLTTASIAVFIFDNWNGWIRYRVEPGTMAYFNRHDNMIGPCKTLLWSIGVMLGDYLMLWRLYMVWSRSIRIIIAPIIGILAYGSCSIFLCSRAFQSAYLNRDDHDYQVTTVLMFSTLALGVLTNLYTTVMIVGRLWWTGRQVQLVGTIVDTPKNWYTNIILAMAESGAMYTIAGLATIITSAAVSNAFIIFACADAIIVGIVPTLLVLLLHVNMVKEKRRNAVTEASGTGFQFSHRARSSSKGEDNDTDARDGSRDIEYQEPSELQKSWYR